MVTVYTQYRKHFKGPRWDDFAVSEYNRKRDYRIGRRSVEHRHQPLEWDSSESENSDVDFETKRETKTQSQRAGISHLSDEKRARKKDIANENLAGKRLKEVDKPPVHVKTVKQAWGTEHDERFNKEMAAQSTHGKHSKHRQRKRKKRGKCKTEEEGKSLVNDREGQNERVPFVSYGWANDAPIEKKYTHNVRADAKDVSGVVVRGLKLGGGWVKCVGACLNV